MVASSFLREERLHPGRAPPGLAVASDRVAAPTLGQWRVPASCLGLEPLPCLPSSLPPRQQDCPRAPDTSSTLTEGSPGVLRRIAVPLPPSASGTQAKT